MSFFSGQQLSRLDAKGRVSIPASFRQILRQRGMDPDKQQLILRSSHQQNCGQGQSLPDFETEFAQIQALPKYSPERNAMSKALLSSAQLVPIDREGRVVLPEAVMQKARITDAVLFVGVGDVFEIWEPDAYAIAEAEAVEISANVQLPAVPT